jgi:[CysO sulfur-carrier protein]-S-L-cysteine hydrolase
MERNGVIEIPADIRDAMIAQARQELPNEACGLLAGREGRVERFYPIANEDQSHLTYRLDGKQQLLAESEIDDKNWEVIGVFHSHTHTEAFPSKTDRKQAFWPDPETGMRVYSKAEYVIVSLMDPEPSLRAFWIEDADRVTEQEVRIV